MRQRGYFKAACNFDSIPVGKYKTAVRYNLVLGPLYKISGVEFTSRDSLVNDLINKYAGESLIQKDAPLDARLFESERLRITSLLKNRGYAYFVPQFVQFTGDSTGTSARIRVNVLPFSDSIMHQTYRIGKVEVYSGVVPESDGTPERHIY
jgi:outer membrane protein assembly factor BamA